MTMMMMNNDVGGVADVGVDDVDDDDNDDQDQTIEPRED